MPDSQPIFGAGRVFAHGQLLALVEYVLIVTVLGRQRLLDGTISVLEGNHELPFNQALVLQLSDGTTTHIILGERAA